MHSSRISTTCGNVCCGEGCPSATEGYYLCQKASTRPPPGERPAPSHSTPERTWDQTGSDIISPLLL